MSANQSVITVTLRADEARTTARAVDQDLEKIGATAQRAGVSGAAGLAQLEQSVAANRQASAVLGVAIAANRSEMTNLGIAMKTLEDQGRKTSVEYDNLATRLRVLRDETSQLSATQGQLTADTRLASQQINTMSPAGGSAAQAIRLMGAESRLLGGHLQGLARPLAMIVNGIGVMTTTQLAWIAGIGIAIAVITRLVTAKKELIEVDEKQVALDVVSAQLGGNQVRVQADLISAFRNLATQSDSYQKNTQELNKAYDDLITKGRSTVFNFDSQGRSMEVTAKSASQLQSTISSLRPGS